MPIPGLKFTMLNRQTRLLTGAMTMLMLLFAQTACGLGASAASKVDPSEIPEAEDSLVEEGAETREIVVAGGCFWCVEGVLERLNGVTEAESGYAGGTADTANYAAVCSGTTDHAEAVRVVYDPSKITLARILKVFFTVAHDPTHLNRQGNDRGPQYRSAVFYADDEQKAFVEAYIAQLAEAKVFDDPIVTTLEPLEAFFVAEADHQDFVENNPNQGYVQGVAVPKIEKLEEHYGDDISPAGE